MTRRRAAQSNSHSIARRCGEGLARCQRLFFAFAGLKWHRQSPSPATLLWHHPHPSDSPEPRAAPSPLCSAPGSLSASHSW